MSTKAQEPTRGLMRIIVRPDETEHPIGPWAEALGSTPDGLPLSPVLRRGPVVAGAVLYRLCRARNHPCPAAELDADLGPAGTLARVLDLVESLGPGPRSVLAATRCRSHRDDPDAGAKSLSAAAAAKLAGVSYPEGLEAWFAVADPVRLGRLWLAPPLGGVPTARAAEAGPTAAGEKLFYSRQRGCYVPARVILADWLKAKATPQAEVTPSLDAIGNDPRAYGDLLLRLRTVGTRLQEQLRRHDRFQV